MRSIPRPDFGRGGNTPPPTDPMRYSANEANAKVDAMLVAGGALVRVNDAARADGIIVAQQHRGYDPSTAVPTVILRNDDFGRVERLLADGLRCQARLRNRQSHLSRRQDQLQHDRRNSRAPTKPSEVVMLGGHLDSWHGGTGATDNAIGCSIMMEAARLIQISGVKPRRTIRVRLWSGEEEGLLGSLAYVKAHFGTAEDPKPEFVEARRLLQRRFAAPDGCAAPPSSDLRKPPRCCVRSLRSFTDWGLAGVITTTSRAVAGTDSTSFNNAGLPGIGLQQDPIEYNSMTHHTNLDTYERIIPEDVQESGRHRCRRGVARGQPG